MKPIATVAALVVAVLVALAVYAPAGAQVESIELRLTQQVEGLDPEPAGTDFPFVAPTMGGDITIKPGGSIFINAAPTVSFTFTAVELDGWEFVSASCTGTTDVTVDGLELSGTAQGADVLCTFTSRAVEPDPANLTITKSVVGVDPVAGGTPFEFTNDVNDATNTLRSGESFSLSFRPPRVTVREVPQIGWSVTDFTCDGATEVVSSALLQAHTIVAPPGADVSCTFVNEQSVAAEVTVTKRVVGANPTDPTFDFTVNDTLTDFQLRDGESVQVTLNQGTYTFAEAPLAGWQTPTITCGDEEPVTANEITITLSGGETACEFVNRADSTDLLGDVNCDGVINILDAFNTSQFVVQLRTGANGCPLASPSTEINLDAVSIGGAPVTILDAARIAQCVVGTANTLCPA